MRPGFWHPVLVLLRSSSPLDGWVVVEISAGSGSRLRYRRPVHLPGNSPRGFLLTLPLLDLRAPVGISLETEGRTVVRTAVRVSSQRIAQGLVAVVDQEGRGPGRLADPGRRTAVVVRERDLPEDPLAYTSLDALAIRTLEERELNQRQQDALKAWVLHGGRVLLERTFRPSGPLGVWLRAVASSPVGLGSVQLWDPADPWPEDPRARPPRRSVEWSPLEAARPRPPFGLVALGLAGTWLALFLALRAGARHPGGWIGIPVAVGVATAGLLLLAAEVRRQVTLPDRRWVTVVVEGIAWTYGVASHRSAYGGPVSAVFPPGSSVLFQGSFLEADVWEDTEGVRVRLHQQPAQPLFLRWERVSGEELSAEVDRQGRWLDLRGGRLGRSWLVWKGREIEFSGLREGRTPLDPGAWRPVDGTRPGIQEGRRMVPAWDAIIGFHPVLLAESGGGWVVLVAGLR
ncbi:MAG: hypothetical protein QN193_00350 [Armatimonadota bacterium]|nr:hypothetical protein [Armatimonadota bacterium]MDR7569041.1 hypothetical protein [Armatimonadota bacterium]MDR7613930.1 hypothetical protein [Armatimonadota bacterium]